MPKPSKTKKKSFIFGGVGCFNNLILSLKKCTQCDCLAPAVFCEETCRPAVNASCRYFCYVIMQHSVGNRKHTL